MTGSVLCALLALSAPSAISCGAWLLSVADVLGVPLLAAGIEEVAAGAMELLLTVLLLGSVLLLLLLLRG